MGSISYWHSRCELADSAAVEADNLSEEDQSVSHHDIRRLLHKKSNEAWNQLCTQQPLIKLYAVRKNVYENPSYKPAIRRDQIILFWLHIGHSVLSRSHLIKKTLPTNTVSVTPK